MNTETQKYTLAIEDIMAVKVKLNLLSRGVWKKFDFTLFAKRLTHEEVTSMIKVDGEEPISEFAEKVATGWEGQRLVLDEAGNPAPFSKEALAAISSVSGVAALIYQAYMRDLGAREKN